MPSIHSTSRLAGAAAFAGLMASSGLAMAEPLSVQATLAPKARIRLDFKDGSGRFVLMVRREGAASGSGLFQSTR